MGKLESGVVVADRFRLERLIGRGGMGEVWRAHHLALDVPCALKVIDDRSADDAEYRARFQQEAQAAARLRHPNVVQVLDHGVWGDMPWIAMELLDGESLADRLERVGRLSLIETLAVVGDIASALERARGLGIVHRDLKPENILLTPEGAKLLDFGVAKLSRGALEGAKTATGVFLGTPQYCSPEQAHGARDVDHRSDLWSLAIVVFEAVTGARPFDGDGMGEVLAAVLTKKPPSPSSIEPSLPAALDGWWSRATASEPAERFQTAAELADALRAVVDASGATAGPPPSPQGPAPASSRAAHASTVRATEGLAERSSATLEGEARPVAPPRPTRSVASAVAVLGVVAVVGVAVLTRSTGAVPPAGASVEPASSVSADAPLATSASAAEPASVDASARPDASTEASAAAARDRPALPTPTARPRGGPSAASPKRLEPGY